MISKCKQNKNEFYASIFLSLATTFMLYIFAPIDLFAANLDSLWFDIYQLIPCLLLQFVLFLIANIAVLIIALCINAVFNRVLLLVQSGALLLLYIQGTFLTKNLGVLNLVKVEAFNRSQIMLSVLVTAIIAILALVLVKLVKIEKLVKSIKYLSFLFVLMLFLSGFLELYISGGFEKRDTHLSSIRYLKEYSSNNNVIVLILDAVSSNVFSDALGEYNDYTNQDLLKDFTFYRNTAGKYAYTSYAIPHLFTGKEFLYNTSLKNYSKNSFKDSGFINKISEKNYKLYFYEPLMGTDITFYPYEKIENVIVDETTEISSYKELRTMINKLVAYKYLPFFIKNANAIDDIDFNSIKKSEFNAEAYWWGLLEFLNYSDSQEFSIIEENVFKVIHLVGTHEYAFLNRNLEIVGDNKSDTYESKYEQLLGCCKVIDIYLNSLKQAGVYENSTIFIISDHGQRKDKDNSINTLQYGINPILLVKTGNNTHMGISDAPISFDDLPKAFLDATDDSITELFKYKEGDKRERFYYYKVGDAFLEYRLVGDVNNPDILEPTGKEYAKKLF